MSTATAAYLVQIIDGANFDRVISSFIVMGDSTRAHDLASFEGGKHAAKVFLTAQAEGDTMAREWADAIRYEVTRHDVLR